MLGFNEPMTVIKCRELAATAGVLAVIESNPETRTSYLEQMSHWSLKADALEQTLAQPWLRSAS
jgi:hypothetical protein